MYQFTFKHIWKIAIEIYFRCIKIKVSAPVILEETTQRSSSYGSPSKMNHAF
jgi:hypothetical protein